MHTTHLTRTAFGGVLIASLAFMLASACPLVRAAKAQGTPQVVNVYTARHYDTDMALYDQFTTTTGIKVNLIEGDSDGLIQRIVSEGEFSPADMLITVDAGRLWRAQQAGVFRSVESQVLTSRVPAHLRDPGNQWFGLSKRGRVIVYNKAAGLPAGITDYEHLTDKRLANRVCMRSSGNIYNQSLLAALTAHHGVEAATRWASGVVANFARPPQGNDTAQLRAVAAGECGVSIANTYYIGRFVGSDDPADQALMARLGVLFPNQAGRGAHVNISGAGITRHAPNAANALQFLEYLTGEFAQKLFAEGNNEYPVSGPTTGPIAQLGEFKEDPLNAVELGSNQNAAVKAFDRAGWR